METNSSKGKPINVNDLAVERNRLAAERTLMAWIRTALSMITFGFTIYKFMQVMQNQSTSFVVRNAHAPRTVGLTLISIGTFALLIACIQHYRYIKNLAPGQPYKFLRDLSFLVACLLGLLGLLMFGSIAFNTGPFQ